MEHYFYKLSQGADVYEKLNELHSHHQSTSFLISSVGDLSKVSFKCPSDDKPITLEKKLEIITLSGFLTNTSSHFHISVSDQNCSVFGGHLLPGTTVLKSLDVLVGVLPDLQQISIDSKYVTPSIVDIYVLPDCPWSKRALNLLDSHNIKYNYHLITNDDEFRNVNNRTSFNTFPQIFIKNEFIGGYSELADLSNNGYLFKLIS